jgi:small subunit ribosomal protein S1
MSNPTVPDPQLSAEDTESFADLLSQYERAKKANTEPGPRQIEATVVQVTADSVILDIGFKSEGILPLTAFQTTGESVKPGDRVLVSVKGRGPEGYYELSRGKIRRATDWASLEQAFNDKATIVGVVTAVVKGGLSVDVGVRAFMPASRSGTREAGELEKLVEQEIRCRIIKLDVTDEDVVVDRRVVLEEEEREQRDRRYSQLKEGDTVSGTVRSLTDYGAFVDIGGVDALLHVGDIAYSRISKPADVLSVGQAIEATVLKISSDGDKRRISIGMKQLQANPWSIAAQKYKIGERVRGTVTRVVEFGAFVELEPGIEGLIHVSEMSWAKKVRIASDVVKPGETVEAIVLGVNTDERRISLGLKQTLGDPWSDIAQKVSVGSVLEGPVTTIMKFGAFVQISEGVEGMIHIGDITGEKRLNHPQEMLKAGQIVRAQVLGVDKDKRQIRLGMKQLAPSDLDEFIAEHKAGDVVSGRIVERSGDQARVELGEGIQVPCLIPASSAGASSEQKGTAKADLSSLTSMLQARWKGGASNEVSKVEMRAGEVHSFRITRLDPGSKQIELELAR